MRQAETAIPARSACMDYFRVLCCLLVIYYHVYGVFSHIVITAETGAVAAGCLHFLRHVASICVPGFVLLSGAFMLGRQNPPPALRFYWRTGVKIGFPFLIVAGYHLISHGIQAYENGVPLGSNLYLRGVELVLGYTSYHLWYINLFFELVLITPLLWALKKRIPGSVYTALGIALLIGASLTYENLHPDNHHIGESAFYVGYYILGDCIRNAKILHRHWVTLLIAAFVFNVIVCDFTQAPTSFHFLQPVTIISSVLLYASAWGWKLPSSRIVNNLASNSYFIYLVHIAIFQGIILANMAFINSIISISAIPYIAGGCIITLILSWGCAEIWNRAAAYCANSIHKVRSSTVASPRG